MAEDDEIRLNDISDWLHTRSVDEELVGAIFKTLKNFWASTDDEITKKFTPRVKKRQESKPIFFTDAEIVCIVEQARYIWTRMISIKNEDDCVKISHDGI